MKLNDRLWFIYHINFRDSAVMPTLSMRVTRGSNVAVTTTMGSMRARSTSTTTMVMPTTTIRGARFLSSDYNKIKLLVCNFHSVVIFKDIMVMYIVEVLFLFNN